MKIGVFSNANKDPNGAITKAVFAAAKARGMDVESFVPDRHYDFVAVIGGDGTILRVADGCAVSESPVLGINKGTVGFLTETEPDDISNAFDKLKSRDYFIERRAMLDATVDGVHRYALNDVVVTKSSVSRAIALEVRVGDTVIDKFKCDGFIVGTPTGSTAYSLSAGGAVISPNVPVISLTPINPHTVRARSVVVGSFETVSIACVGSEPAAVVIDGEQTDTLHVGEKITVTGRDRSVLFVRFGKNNFYTRMLCKLGSGRQTEGE